MLRFKGDTIENDAPRDPIMPFEIVRDYKEIGSGLMQGNVNINSYLR